jgi:guanylate kinase
LVKGSSVITIGFLLKKYLNVLPDNDWMKTSCLFTIAAPSGAGKTSLLKALLKDDSINLCVSVSHTTRKIRPGETDSQDYHFVDQTRFLDMVKNDEFLEHAQVFDNYYGTAVSSVDHLLDSGKHVILEIDWQGARQVKVKMPGTISICILPPSREELEQRLIARGTDDKTIIERRMKAADQEMSHFNDAEYIVVNKDFDQALADLKSIIYAQSLVRERQKLKFKALIDSIPQ